MVETGESVTAGELVRSFDVSDHAGDHLNRLGWLQLFWCGREREKGGESPWRCRRSPGQLGWVVQFTAPPRRSRSIHAVELASTELFFFGT